MANAEIFFGILCILLTLYGLAEREKNSILYLSIPGFVVCAMIYALKFIEKSL